jgi:predicted transcriptional regulator
MSVTTRISDRAKQRVERLAEEKGISQQEVLDKALEVYERECFLESVNAGFAALQADAETWAEELQERALWDAAGVEPETD